MKCRKPLNGTLSSPHHDGKAKRSSDLIWTFNPTSIDFYSLVKSTEGLHLALKTASGEVKHGRIVKAAKTRGSLELAKVQARLRRVSPVRDTNTTALYHRALQSVVWRQLMAHVCVYVTTCLGEYSIHLGASYLA